MKIEEGPKYSEEESEEISQMLEFASKLPLEDWEEVEIASELKTDLDRVYSATVKLPNLTVAVGLEYLSSFRSSSENFNNYQQGFYLRVIDLEKKDPFGENVKLIYHIGENSQGSMQIDKLMEKIYLGIEDRKQNERLEMEDELRKEFLSAIESTD